MDILASSSRTAASWLQSTRRAVQRLGDSVDEADGLPPPTPIGSDGAHGSGHNGESNNSSVTNRNRGTSKRTKKSVTPVASHDLLSSIPGCSTQLSMLNLPCDKVFHNAFLTGELDLRSRQLKEFPLHYAQVYDIRDLIAADLSQNRFSTLPPLDECHALERLELRANALRSLPAVALSPLISLSYLDLSQNQLVDLPPALFALPLKILLLAANRLEHVPMEIRHLADTLEELDLSANRLHQVPAVLSMLTQLRVLNLRANQLTSVPGELGTLQVRIFDLSANLLIRLPTEFHQLADFCTHFRVDGNPLLEPPTSAAQRGRAHIFKWLQSRAASTRDLMGTSVTELKLGSVKPGLGSGMLPNSVLYTTNALGIADFTRATTLNATMRRTTADRSQIRPEVRRAERRSRSIRGARCTDSGYYTNGDDFSLPQPNGPNDRATTSSGQAKIGALAEEILRTFEATTQLNGTNSTHANRLMDLSNNNVTASPQQQKRTSAAQVPTVGSSPSVETQRPNTISTVRLSATSVDVKVTNERKISTTSTVSIQLDDHVRQSKNLVVHKSRVRTSISPIASRLTPAATVKPLAPTPPPLSRPSTAQSDESSGLAATSKRQTPPPTTRNGRVGPEAQRATTSRTGGPPVVKQQRARAPATTIGKSATLQRPKRAVESRTGSTLSLASTERTRTETKSRPNGIMAKSMMSARVQPIGQKEPLRTQNGQVGGQSGNVKATAEKTKRPAPSSTMSKSMVTRPLTNGTTKKAPTTDSTAAVGPKTSAAPTPTLAQRNGSVEPAKSSAQSTLINEMRTCLSSVLGDTNLPPEVDQMAAQLADGVLLCAFLNAIRPNAIPTVIRPSSASSLSITRARRNVESFVGACREFGVPTTVLCHPADVLEKKNLQHTAKTVLSLRKRLCS